LPTTNDKEVHMDHDHGALRAHLKRLPGRDRLDDLHRVALTVPDPDDAAMVHAMADLLQGLRQATRGGRLDPNGGRRWSSSW